MGNSVSSDTTVYVHLQETSYRAGDVISASIFVNASRPVHIRGLQLQIHGQEFCSWQDIGRLKHDRIRRGESVILQFAVPVLGSGVLQPGQYEIPIKCQLPDNLVGTFNYAEQQNRAQISYTVDAHLGTISGLLDAHHATTINLVQTHVPRTLVNEHTKLINRFGCVYQGAITAKLEVLGDVAVPGHPFPVRVQITNRSRVAISTVNLWLDHHILLRAGAHQHKIQKRRTQRRSLAASDNWSALRGDSACLELQMQIPVDLPPTRIGTIVSSLYELTVQLVTPSWHSDVRLTAPITVDDRLGMVEGVPLPSAPPGWGQPVVYPTLQFAPASGSHIPPPHPVKLAAPPTKPAPVRPTANSPAPAKKQSSRMPVVAESDVVKPAAMARMSVPIQHSKASSAEAVRPSSMASTPGPVQPMVAASPDAVQHPASPAMHAAAQQNVTSSAPTGPPLGMSRSSYPGSASYAIKEPTPAAAGPSAPSNRAPGPHAYGYPSMPYSAAADSSDVHHHANNPWMGNLSNPDTTTHVTT